MVHLYLGRPIIYEVSKHNFDLSEHNPVPLLDEHRSGVKEGSTNNERYWVARGLFYAHANNTTY